jgi:hypothetical protein
VIGRAHLGGRHRLHLLDVGAGGERLLRTGDDDRADAVVFVERDGGRRDLVSQLRVQRVQRLRPIEGDPPHASALFDQDRLVLGHR